MQGERVTVSNTATKVVASDGRDPQPLLFQIPAGGVTVWLGGADVNTTDKGYPVPASATIPQVVSVDLATEDLYAVVASGTQDVYILRHD